MERQVYVETQRVTQTHGDTIKGSWPSKYLQTDKGNLTHTKSIPREKINNKRNSTHVDLVSHDSTTV